MRTSRFLRGELCEIIAIDRVRSVALILVFFSLLIFVPLQSAAQSSAHQTPEIRIIVVETQTEAAQILERLQAGEDCATLAREKSIDPSSSNGGSLGGLDPAALRTELRDAVRGAGKGQLAGPVKILTGLAILKVEDSSAAAASTPPAPTAGAAQGGAAVATTGQGMTPTGLLALAGRGKVPYPPDVSGAVEVEVAFRTLPKPPDWDHDLRSVCEVRKQTLARAVDHLGQLLDPNDTDSYVAT